MDNKKISEMDKYQVLEYLKEEINELLIRSISKNHIPTPDNPIEFETDKGRFRYEGEGKIFIQPIKSLEFINVDITILPTGTEFNEFNKKNKEDDKVDN